MTQRILNRVYAKRGPLDGYRALHLMGLGAGHARNFFKKKK